MILWRHFTAANDTGISTFGLPRIHRYTDMAIHRSARWTDIPTYRQILHNPRDLKDNPFAREAISSTKVVSPAWPRTPKIDHFGGLGPMRCFIILSLHFTAANGTGVSTFWATQNPPIYRYGDTSLCPVDQHTHISTDPPRSSRFKG